MENRLENTLITCLCNTLQVMLCSESPGAIHKVNTLLKKYPLFNLSKISSAEKIPKEFNKTPKWHSLIIDGNCTFSKEFFASLKTLPSWVPIIVLRDNLSKEILQYLETYFNSQDYVILDDVSKYMIRKTKKRNISVCQLSNEEKLLSMLQKLSIKKKLLPRAMPVDMIENAIDVLFQQNPLSVEEWVAILNVSPRKLQRTLKQFTGYSPKKVITLYHAYQIAFNKFDGLNDSNHRTDASYIVDERSKTRVIEYVLSRQSQLFTVNE